MAPTPPHTLARSERHPAYAGKRALVADDVVAWATPWEAYAPVEYTHESVLAEPPWADAVDAKDVAELPTRASFEGALVFAPADKGRPRNPRGRTGTTGRGLLGKWGPNHAADPIVVRVKPGSKGEYEMVAIKRNDTGEWAIPGGMVDPGEHVSLTLRREFTEEAGNIEDPKERAEFEAHLDAIFAKGRLIYEGSVDDPRNTDNAWIETTVYLFMITDDAIATSLKLVGGDDATQACWLDLDEAGLASLYADHRVFVERAIAMAAA